jgi:hypothetical protein
MKNEINEIEQRGTTVLQCRQHNITMRQGTNAIRTSTVMTSTTRSKIRSNNNAQRTITAPEHVSEFPQRQFQFGMLEKFQFGMLES